VNKSKDKRIKKLKRKHIWPSVLGLILILFICFIAIVMVLSVSIVDIVFRKISTSNSQSVKIAQMYEDYNEDNKDEINKSILSYIDMSSEIESVYILDEAGDKVWASDDAVPNIDEAVKLNFTNEKEYIDIILEDNENQLFSVKGEILELDRNVLSKVNIDKFLDEDKFFKNDESNSILALRAWIVIPVEDMNVCVLNNVYLYGSDLFMLIMTISLFVVLIVIFAIFYLISVIGVILSMRKTTKVLYTDVVTGGDNWLAFVKKGTSILKRNKTAKSKYAMLHMKMRKYRSFCTCFGVRDGEELIEKFYVLMKKKISSKEAMAHRENGEFGLLVSYTDKEQLLARISDLDNLLNTVLPDMSFSFSVGVYEVQAGEKDLEQIYNNAILACDMISEDAEEQVAFFDIEMNKIKLWERKVEDDMYKALERREFKVYLQPKFSAKGEELAGAEALVRWIHPTEGLIPPNKFIPIFEKNGFILQLDDYMLREIARQQAQWILEGRKIVPISVNVSRAHFTREDLAEHICSIVDRFQVPHNMIELELTESAFFDDKYVLLKTVKRLKKAGFIVSMDDFGAGYSSLNSLKELNIDVLKIDADFFRGADVEERGMLIVSEVIDLAKKLNMKIVAEGIESREQVDFLAEQECDLIQGYFFAKPMPIDEFIEKYNLFKERYEKT